MSDQFPWLDWPQGYAPANLNRNAPRAEENSSSQQPPQRSPFYNSQTQFNNNNPDGQSQYYAPYQQQDETYVRLEDVLQYPAYPRHLVAAPDYHRQSSYRGSTQTPPVSSRNQPPPKPAAPPRLPSPRLQATSRPSHLAKDMDSSPEAKRRRIDSSATSQAPSQATPQASSHGVSHATTQARTHSIARHARPGSQYVSPFSNAASGNTSHAATQARSAQYTRPGSQHVSASVNGSSQAASQSVSQPASQPMGQSRPQQNPRPKSQYASPVQSQATPSAPTRTASRAASQNVPRPGSQYASPVQSHATPQASSHTSSQASSQNIPRPDSQYAGPAQSQAAPQAPPSRTNQAASQATTQRASQHNSQSNWQYNSSQTTNQGSSNTVSRSATQGTSQPTSSQPVSHLGALSAAPSVPPCVPPPNLPPIGSSTTAATAPGPARSWPPQTTSQMTQVPHPQPTHGPFGKFAGFSYQPQDPTDKPFLKRRADIVSRLREEDAEEKVTYNPKTIARDILIAAGRHPTEQPLNHHLSRLRDVFSFVDLSSDLQTFRWHLVDPVDEPSGQGRRLESGQKGVCKSSRDLGSAAPPKQTSQAPQIAVPVVGPNTNTNNNNHPPPQPSIQVRNYTQQNSQQLPAVLQPQPQYQPQLPPPQPQSQPQPPPPPKPQSAPRSPADVGQPGTPQPKMTGRGRGRPPGSGKKQKLVVAPPAPAVNYPVFACQWGNCQAELHSLELLKKHIFKVHVSYQITCGWKSCTFTGTLPAAKLFKHVKEAHLDSIAWELGDGPSVPTSVDQDSGGKTVPLTIPESNQPGSEDSLIFPASYSSIRAYNRVHGNHSQSDKARGILKAVQRLKERIGVGLDPGGCELATPSRNERVSNDGDVYEVRSEPSNGSYNTPISNSTTL